MLAWLPATHGGAPEMGSRLSTLATCGFGVRTSLLTEWLCNSCNLLVGEPHWRPQPAKLPSFGEYSLETLPYLTCPQPTWSSLTAFFISDERAFLPKWPPFLKWCENLCCLRNLFFLFSFFSFLLSCVCHCLAIPTPVTVWVWKATRGVFEEHLVPKAIIIKLYTRSLSFLSTNPFLWRPLIFYMPCLVRLSLISTRTRHYQAIVPISSTRTVWSSHSYHNFNKSRTQAVVLQLPFFIISKLAAHHKM